MTPAHPAHPAHSASRELPSSSVGTTVELAGGLRLELDAGGAPRRVLDRGGRGVELHPHPALRGPVDAAELRSGADRRSVLFGERRGAALHHVRFDPPRVRHHPLGERLSGSEQLELHVLASGFLVRTEHGLSAIDTEGGLCWRIDEPTVDWCFEGEQDGVVWCSDAHGNLLGFDAAHGAPR